MKCDHGGCQTDAVVTLTATYPLDWNTADRNPHELWRAYPAPMFRACRNHMAVLCERDAAAPASTNAWIVRPI